MNIVTPYIPREYLALKINYCRQQLAALPEVVRKERLIDGKLKEVYVVNNHVYSPTSKAGIKFERIMNQREELTCDLLKYEGEWYSSFRRTPPEDIQPLKISRSFLGGDGMPIVMNGSFFDSLKANANSFHPESKTHYYNGTYYRSSAEREIARFYTEQGIPFKYEPEMWINGLPYAIYPDFVILIKELDLCKIHEHFGMMGFANYVRDTQKKYTNYSQAGLIPDFDVIFTYNFNTMPFELSTLSTKLNHVIYDSLFVVDMPA